MFTACLPQSHGVLDDHFECWFLTEAAAIDPDSGHGGEAITSVAGLPNGLEWLDPPTAAGRRASVSEEVRS